MTLPGKPIIVGKNSKQHCEQVQAGRGSGLLLFVRHSLLPALALVLPRFVVSQHHTYLLRLVSTGSFFLLGGLLPLLLLARFL